MNKSEIYDKFAEYMQLNKELVTVRKEQRELKKRADVLEKIIKEYMTNNAMDNITLKDGEIVLYARKIPQTFRKDTIVEKLTEKLNDVKMAEDLTESIMTNKKYIVEDKLRAVAKKNSTR